MCWAGYTCQDTYNIFIDKYELHFTSDISTGIKRIVYRLSVYDNICRYEYFKRIGLITFVLFWQGKSYILFSDSQHFMGQFFLNKVKNIYHRTTQSHHTFVDMLHFGMQ